MEGDENDQDDQEIDNLKIESGIDNRFKYLLQNNGEKINKVKKAIIRLDQSELLKKIR